MLPISFGAILLGLALLIVVVLFLARPFLKPQPQQTLDTSERQALSARKEGLLDAIRTLDFDHDTGKIPDQEYELQRAALMNEAAATLKALDELPPIPVSEDVYAQIEAALGALRSQRAERTAAPANFCSSCGQRLDAGDRFCANCGQPVYAAQPSV
jgi:hypothetical protein